jgi:hypothetical protein
MTTKAFDWNPKTWTVDYKHHFDECKKAILEASTIYMPDYSLPWILRPDASAFAVGAVLLQLAQSTEPGKTIEQPLSLVSKKLSKPARNWATIKAEAYAIYYAVTANEYFLRGKPFIIETDHANLQWMDKSTDTFRAASMSWPTCSLACRTVQKYLRCLSTKPLFYSPSSQPLTLTHRRNTRRQSAWN